MRVVKPHRDHSAENERSEASARDLAQVLEQSGEADAAGHAAGDAVLCKVAAACRLTVRSSDIVARLGGDEFAVILENCAEDRAKYIGQQLLRTLNPLEFEWRGSSHTIGASIGLAMNTMDMSDEKSWLEAADKACYDAKRQGRGRLRIAARMQGVELPTKQG
jgi:diguanylate cyclase (GGDEF)-like protein